jgi:CRISPR/Cas system-associated exonuclease Cas4 (RecB family)
MQLQQLHGELRKLRRELDMSYEAREDLQDELKEMTSLYLNMKQERDKYR